MNNDSEIKEKNGLFCLTLKPEMLRIVETVTRYADDLGMKAYMTGGAVRDIILGRPAADLDMAVEGDAIEVGRKIALDTGSKLIEYPEFRTCKLCKNDPMNTGDLIEEVDITTARREIYASSGAYPEISPADIIEDLKRRDFTINAMAVRLEDGNNTQGTLIDPFNGKKDIVSALIRVLHEKSFEDDPLRILRALRFSKRFSFELEKKTETLMNKAIKAGSLDNIKPARLKDEAENIYKTNDPEEYIEYLSGILGPCGEKTIVILKNRIEDLI